MIDVNDYKLFTIIIPTYNRSKQLEENLRAALPQVEKYKDYARVYVSDNNSPDDTENVVKRYLAKYPDCLIYFRQEKNIGGTPNFFHAARRVNSKYICLSGDDDFLSPYYLETVIPILISDANYSFVNYNLITVNYDKSILGIRDKVSLRKTYQCGGDFLKEHLIVPSLMTSNIFVRDLFLKESESARDIDIPGYDWFYFFCKSIVDKKGIYIGHPIAYNQMPNSQPWSKYSALYHIYGLGKTFKLLDKYAPGVYDIWNKFVYKEHPDTISYLLNIVNLNRNYYKGEIFGKMRPYIKDESVLTQFEWALKYSPKMFHFKMNPIHFIINKIRRIF